MNKVEMKDTVDRWISSRPSGARKVVTYPRWWLKRFKLKSNNDDLKRVVTFQGDYLSRVLLYYHFVRTSCRHWKLKDTGNSKKVWYTIQTGNYIIISTKISTNTHQYNNSKQFRTRLKPVTHKSGFSVVHYYNSNICCDLTM